MRSREGSTQKDTRVQGSLRSPYIKDGEVAQMALFNSGKLPSVLLQSAPLFQHTLTSCARAEGHKGEFITGGKTEPIFTLVHSVVCWKAPEKTIRGQFVVLWTFCSVKIFISFLDNSQNFKRSVGLPQERPLNTGLTVLSSARISTNVILAGKCDSRHHSTTGLGLVLAGRPRPHFQRPQSI